MKSRRAIGDTAKFIKADDSLRVGGYLVRFTDKDNPDLHGEYFSKDTDFWMERGYQIKGERVLLEHGLDDFAKVMPIGILDMVKLDDVGIYVEARLHDRDDYEEMLRQMRDSGKSNLSSDDIRTKSALAHKAIEAIVETGKVQWSSGALPQSVEVDDSHITSWAIMEGSLTFTPAESDGTEIRAVKSALEQLQDLVNIQSPAPRKDASNGHKDAKADDGSSNTTDNVDNEEDIMPEEVMALLERMQAQISEIAAQMGASDPDKAADEVIDEIKADDDEDLKAEDMDEEEMAKALSDKAFTILSAKIEKQQSASKAAKVALDAKAKAWARNRKADTSNLGGFSADDPNKDNSDKPRNIEVRSKFTDWTASDFSFAASIAKMTNSSFRPDVKFYREFADKAEKAYAKGEFHLGQKAIRGINAIKADELDYSTQVGYGDEWVFTAWSESVWDKPRLDNVVVTAFQNIEMPSNPYDYPVESTDPTVKAVAETNDETELTRNDANSPIPDSKIGTNKVQFNAKKHALRVNISAELEEDGIARLMPKFREQAERAILDGHDNVALNGDTSTSGNINLDGGTPTDQNYTSYDGLLHQALVSATTNAVNAEGASPTLAHIRTLRSKLGNAQGFNPRNLAIFTDFQTYIKLLSIDAVLTIDKIGSQATVATGSLGQIDGINVFVSGQMALADTDGKVTGAGNVTDTGRLAIVYTPDWFVGYRRRVVQHVNFLPVYDMWELIMTVRHALTARSYSSSGAQQSTDDSVAVLYNIGI